jgi:hypothetical protein
MPRVSENLRKFGIFYGEGRKIAECDAIEDAFVAGTWSDKTAKLAKSIPEWSRKVVSSR